MVTGIEKFKEHFRDNANAYILIGGAACDYRFSDLGLDFRATKDLDIILIVEALDNSFVKSFWDFIKEGKYKIIQKSSGKPCFYRFIKPQKADFPSQLELFSRKPDILGDFQDGEITPIPTDEELSSLSAIIMNNEYYNFTIKNSDFADGLHLAKTETLVCLKSKAFTDLAQRKQKGEPIDIKKIKKHLNDLIKLSLTLPDTTRVKLPDNLKRDKELFWKITEEYNPNFKLIGKNFGLNNFSKEDFTNLYNKIFR